VDNRDPREARRFPDAAADPRKIVGVNHVRVYGCDVRFDARPSGGDDVADVVAESAHTGAAPVAAMKHVRIAVPLAGPGKRGEHGNIVSASPHSGCKVTDVALRAPVAQIDPV
jgi:hypothetical protein